MASHAAMRPCGYAAMRPSGHMAAFEKDYCTWPHGRWATPKTIWISKCQSGAADLGLALTSTIHAMFLQLYLLSKLFISLKNSSLELVTMLIILSLLVPPLSTCTLPHQWVTEC